MAEHTGENEPTDLNRIPLFDDEDTDVPATPATEAGPIAPAAWQRLAAAPEPSRRNPWLSAAQKAADVVRGSGEPEAPSEASQEAPAARNGHQAPYVVQRVTGSDQVSQLPGVIAGATPTGQQAPGRRRADVPVQGPSDDGVDWEQVQVLRQLAYMRLSAATEDREGIDEDTRRELARKIIVEIVGEQARELDLKGGGSLDIDDQQRLATAVFESVFGLGRLQPLVDNDDLENIEGRGADNVLLIHNDGRITKGPAVASSNEQLIRDFQFFAAQRGTQGESERPFSPAHPFLDLKLPGNHRLSANAWISPLPYFTIRRHRLVDIDLDDLVERDMLTAGQASFLHAAVRAKLSVIVSGPQGAGKTTLVRASASSIPRWESIGTIETEYELLLHEMVDEHGQLRHPRTQAFEARPGSGERDANGRRIGEISLDDIMYAVLRKNLSRIIVGEVRGLEVLPMLEAMQAGAGSLSTTHATSGRGAIQRLAGLALKGGSHLKEFALTQLAEHIDVIVQIRLEDTIENDDELDIEAEGAVVGHRKRYVSEIVFVEPGENGHPSYHDVYLPGPDGRATPNSMPADLAALLRQHGFSDYGFRIDDSGEL